MGKSILLYFLFLLTSFNTWAQDTIHTNDLRVGANNSTIYMLEMEPDTIIFHFPFNASNSNSPYYFKDFSSVPINDSFEFQFQSYNGAAPFGSATLYLDSIFRFSNGVLPHVRYYYKQTNTGFWCVGMKIFRTVLPLRNVTDSMVIEEQNILFSEYPMPRFPLFYKHDDSYDRSFFRVNCKLTVAPNIIDSPTYWDFYLHGEHLVREYGDVIMPITNDTVATLLLTQNYIVNDTFSFVNTSVPTSVLDSMGFERGGLMLYYRYLIAKNLNYYLGIIENHPNTFENTSIRKVWLINPLHYTFQDPVSVLKPNMQMLTAYPNPAQDEVFFDINSSIGLDYLIVNYIGKTISQGKVHKNSISIAHLSSGNYAVILKEKDKEIGYFKFVKQ